MQNEIQVKFKEIDNSLNILKKHFDWEYSLTRIKELDELIDTENFWNDPPKAQSIMREKKQIEKIIDIIKFIEIEKSNLYELIDLAEEEYDEELITEIINQIDGLAKNVINFSWKVCYLVKLIKTIVLLKFTLVQVVLKHKIGL